MYITADQKIYACERIGSEYFLGTIDEKVHIDFEDVAQKYTVWLSEIKKQCAVCCFVDICQECIFQFPTKNNIPVCPYQYGEESYKNHLSRMIGLLEKHPEVFGQVNSFVSA